MAYTRGCQEVTPMTCMCGCQKVNPGLYTWLSGSDYMRGCQEMTPMTYMHGCQEVNPCLFPEVMSPICKLSPLAWPQEEWPLSSGSSAITTYGYQWAKWGNCFAKKKCKNFQLSNNKRNPNWRELPDSVESPTWRVPCSLVLWFSGALVLRFSGSPVLRFSAKCLVYRRAHSVPESILRPLC